MVKKSEVVVAIGMVHRQFASAFARESPRDRVYLLARQFRNSQPAVPTAYQQTMECGVNLEYTSC